MKIGIFGGTFDPPTPAHKAIIEEVLSKKIVDKVIVVPTVIEYYRKGKQHMLTHEERLIACEYCFRAKNTSHADDIIISSYEYNISMITTDPEDFKSYRFFHTLNGLNAIYNWSNNNEFYTIIGTDSLINFKTWYRWNDLLSMTKLIVVDGRDGIKAESDIPFTKINISSKFANISSTKIREKYNNLEDYLKDFPNVNT